MRLSRSGGPHTANPSASRHKQSSPLIADQSVTVEGGRPYPAIGGDQQGTARHQLSASWIAWPPRRRLPLAARFPQPYIRLIRLAQKGRGGCVARKTP
jgi:hypothetical protein